MAAYWIVPQSASEPARELSPANSKGGSRGNQSYKVRTNRWGGQNTR
jgi:hypothetical protein